MPAMRVVEALDEVEDRQTGRALGRKALPVEQFAFEGSEEALTQRVDAPGRRWLRCTSLL